METILSRHWHHLPTEEVLQLLETDPQRGLDIFEVQHRLKHFGPNVLTTRHGKTPLQRFLDQFNNPLIIILLIATVVTAVVKDLLDASVIFGVVLLNAIVGFIQESRAEQAIRALATAMTTEATVVRAGKTLRIPASEVVPGDLVIIKAGDKVPADLRLIQVRDLQVEEAALTGESLPVQKSADGVLPPETVLAERHNMAYASTLVTYGQATGVVVATGDNTEVGRISELISTAQQIETPLTRKLAGFSRIVLYAILTLAVITTLIGILRGQPFVDVFIAGVALAVAMIPEGLPVAVTVTLAVGVTRMARRRAILRNLPAVETLGSVTVICTDKTGTLTQNQMTVQTVAVDGTVLQVTGSGYAPSGEFLHGGQTIDVHTLPGVMEVLTAGALCNDSALLEDDGHFKAQGDPTEVALIVSALKAGIRREEVEQRLPRLDAIPFESKQQYMATLHDAGPGRPRIVYLKGATEVLLERCVAAQDAYGQRIALQVDDIYTQVAQLAATGLRVLAFAKAELPPGTTRIDHADVVGGLTFLGVQGMIDPPRPEAIAAVKSCQEAGIRVKMITGDHSITAAAIAQQIGLLDPGEIHPGTPGVVSGKMLNEYSDEELITVAHDAAVFARVSPEQKLRLVEALQARGEIVAMTGDGVNDGPALKQADVGIAMGMSGTDVAREASDMIITDDNFATIEAAVEEGRGVYDNLIKIIGWILPTNLGEGLIIMAAILAGVALPVLPIQILWINMTTSVVLGAVLAVEVKEAGIMKRPPRNPNAPILTPEMIWRVILVGVLILIGSFALYELELRLGAPQEQARTVAVNVVMFVETFYLLACRSFRETMFKIGVFSNRWVIVGVIIIVLLQLLFTYVPVMHVAMGSAPIDGTAWGLVIGFSILVYGIVEFEKWLRRRFGK
ncbi:MAG: cation-transporting P-type ATPase [Anaerolineae bacterium]|nr:cation-transporting P-type ATPase [Anaerolineae bacterium]MDW8072134.1 cation-transporting P-type ATPase [Anaerolineae bacterium]